MFKCCNCGKVFERPATYREERSGDGWAFETLTESPCCKDDFVEVYPCELCDNMIPSGDYCEICQMEIQNAMDAAQFELGVSYNEFIKILEWYVERG